MALANDHLQLPLIEELSGQIGRLIFTQIPQFDNLSMGRLLSTIVLVSGHTLVYNGARPKGH